MQRERILITVKTYPTLSQKFGELVCTAGVREDGSWVRLYPVPFRRLSMQEQYRKFQWVDVALVRNASDNRPESFRLLDPDDIQLGAVLGTEGLWAERRRLLLELNPVATDLQALIDEAHANTRSLATFKPAAILDVKVEPGDRRWPADKVAALRARADQGELFSEEGWRDSFQLVRPVPWKFSYRFRDSAGKESTLQILDWETGALYWNCLRAAGNDERVAVQKVRAKYLHFAEHTDLHFFFGTLHTFHQWKSPNPWAIVGVVPFPRQPQLNLL